MLSSTSIIICTPASVSWRRFILSSINLIIESNNSVLPNQQKTYSKMLRSSCSMRFVIPCEKGVSTTMGTLGLTSLMLRAISKTSSLPFPMSVPGIHITRSKLVRRNSFSASSCEATWTKRGGKRRPSFAYSSKIFSSTRPSSSNMKAS